jgi:dethiobiotin synthetase
MFHVKRHGAAEPAGGLSNAQRPVPRAIGGRNSGSNRPRGSVTTEGSDRATGGSRDATRIRSASARQTNQGRRIAPAQFGAVRHDDAATARFTRGVKGRRSNQAVIQPTRSLFSFADPVSPHLAARDAGVRIDLGAIERWIAEHEAPLTLVETAGALFSPIGYGVTNFDLARVVEADAVLLVAPDRLGVLHDLTTTLALAAAKGGSDVGIVLSAPATKDTSTGRNAAEVERLGLGSVVAAFPRAACAESSSQSAAEKVAAWVSQRAGSFR